MNKALSHQLFTQTLHHQP